MNLTNEERRIILNALGLAFSSRWSQYNLYSTYHHDHRMSPLVERGLMRLAFSVPGGLQYYHVTMAGAEAAGVRHKLRREDMLPDERKGQ